MGAIQHSPRCAFFAPLLAARSGRLTFHIIDRVLTPPPALVAAGAALAPRSAG